MLIDGLR